MGGEGGDGDGEGGFGRRGVMGGEGEGRCEWGECLEERGEGLVIGWCGVVVGGWLVRVSEWVVWVWVVWVWVRG